MFPRNSTGKDQLFQCYSTWGCCHDPPPTQQPMQLQVPHIRKDRFISASPHLSVPLIHGNIYLYEAICICIGLLFHAVYLCDCTASLRKQVSPLSCSNFLHQYSSSSLGKFVGFRSFDVILFSVQTLFPFGLYIPLMKSHLEAKYDLDLNLLNQSY